ncbi:FUSC family protein [Corynebacterium sp. NPDC060344]|uniref:FUSC family protein n=1 Tax=Corynebacterium sp. NPDC060344 TaxID=3347101 RepID=UPI003659D5C4
MADHLPPSRHDPLRLLIGSKFPGRRWPGAARAAIALFVPALLAWGSGHADAMLLIASGACAVIYGEGHGYRARAKVIAVAGAVLVAGAFLGSLTGHWVYGAIGESGARWPLLGTVAFASCFATLLVYLTNALRLPPPGAFFFVMVAGAVTLTGRSGVPPATVAGLVGLGALSALVVGMSGALVDRMAPERDAVAGAERAVAEFAASPSDPGRRHRASSALHAAWAALHDADAVRGGVVLDGPRRELAQRAMAMRETMVRLVGDGRGSSGQGSAGRDTDVRGSDGRDTDVRDSAEQGIAESAEAESARPHTAMAPLARPSWRYRIMRSAGLRSHAGVAATRVAVASVVVGTASVAMGLTRPDWAIVSAVMVLQKGPDRISGSVRGLHRFLGSIAGVLLFAAVHAVQPGPVGVLLVLMVCQFFAEVFVPRNYALTCVATTPLALLLGDSLSDPLGETVLSRLAEVAVGCGAAIVVLWVLLPRGAAVVLRTTGRRVLRAAVELEAARDAAPGEGAGTGTGTGAATGADEILQRRRDLQFELHGNQYAAEDAAHDLPEWTARMWPRHLEIQARGYAALSSRR